MMPVAERNASPSNGARGSGLALTLMVSAAIRNAFPTIGRMCELPMRAFMV
jgi:hypothetical protein